MTSRLHRESIRVGRAWFLVNYAGKRKITCRGGACPARTLVNKESRFAARLPALFILFRFLSRQSLLQLRCRASRLKLQKARQ